LEEDCLEVERSYQRLESEQRLFGVHIDLGLA
jgi:hypothetical protein